MQRENLIKSVWNANLKNPITVLVAMRLAFFADGESKCTVSFNQIAKDCGCSRKSAINHINWLQVRGYINKIGGQGHNSANTYVLNFDSNLA